ncbi:RecX family transcriptional regulator [Candidatus Sumerlaeota bacterium]|nr:RecX family transcriptional regulator [Candidatus Sumerlaeota bacterium]
MKRIRTTKTAETNPAEGRGGVVTRLRAADRRARRMAIEIDGEPWVEIDSEIVLRRNLVRGQTLDEKECEEILADDEFLRARRAAAILLHTRSRSVAEMRRLLFERKFSLATVERTLIHLNEVGGLDDERFARDFARRQLGKGGVGARRARERLRRLGVANDAIEAALEEEPAARTDAQVESARRFVERRLARLRSEAPDARRRKLVQALRRAGFEAEAYGDCLEECLRENVDGDISRDPTSSWEDRSGRV